MRYFPYQIKDFFLLKINSYITILSIGVSLVVLNSCKEKELQAMQKLIKHSEDVELFLVKETPINPLEQNSAQMYLCDYEVYSKISISKKQSDSIKTALLDTTNYIYDVKRRCIVMPKYAVRLKTKKDTLDVVLSTKPCSKAIATHSFSNSSKEEEKNTKERIYYIDLQSDNTIIQVVENIITQTK